MKRSQLCSDPEQVRKWLGRSRKRLPAQSTKRAAEADRRAEVRRQVFARDRMCQVLALGAGVYPIGPCAGILTPHHRRKASQGGGYTPECLVTVCCFHNDALEADADLARWAHSVGLVVRQGDAEWVALG